MAVYTNKCFVLVYNKRESGAIYSITSYNLFVTLPLWLGVYIYRVTINGTSYIVNNYDGGIVKE